MSGLALTLALLTGCATTPSSSLDTPRIRVGGLPYPGWTNYIPLTSPLELGVHRYPFWRSVNETAEEVSSGMVYTRHAGFVDVAHVRSTVDWVRYVYVVTLTRLLEPDPAALPPLRWGWLGMNYRLSVRTPEAWQALTTAQRQPLAQQAATVLAQRLAVSISTWHEVGSWYGQMIVPPIREVRSAFTWDDSTSHVLAAQVGQRALAASDPLNPDSWNAAVTREFAAVMADLGPVDAACQNEALTASRGRWWQGTQTLKRDFDIGLKGDQAKRPWRVEGLACAELSQAAAQPTPLALPTWGALKQTTGWHFEPWFEWTVTMPHWLTQDVLGCRRSCEPHVFEGEAALLSAIEKIQSGMPDELTQP